MGRPPDVESLRKSWFCLLRYLDDSRVDGFVASPEKALFDLAWLTAMNRSRVSGSLPETDLKGIHWKEIQSWLRRIPPRSCRSEACRALHPPATRRNGGLTNPTAGCPLSGSLALLTRGSETNSPNALPVGA